MSRGEITHEVIGSEHFQLRRRVSKSIWEIRRWLRHGVRQHPEATYDHVARDMKSGSLPFSELQEVREAVDQHITAQALGKG